MDVSVAEVLIAFLSILLPVVVIGTIIYLLVRILRRVEALAAAVKRIEDRINRRQ